MANTANSFITIQTPKSYAQQILPADTSAQKDLVGTGTNARKITSIVVASDDTAARIVQLSHLIGGVNYILGSFSIPAASGTDGATASVDLLAGGPSLLIPGLPVDNDGQKYVVVNAADKLQIKSTTTVTTAKTIHAIAYGGEF